MLEVRRGYGWKPSLPDFRNEPASAEGLTVLDEVDPRSELSPCYDQGQLGSCTGNGDAFLLEYDKQLDGIEMGTPSRLFIYYCERVMEGTVQSDAGAFGHDGFKVMRRIGVPPETLWPYDIARFASEPPQEAYEAAPKYKIAKYVHPGLGPNITPGVRREIFKRLLSNRQPIGFGFTVYESFESNWAQQGIMPLPQPGESVIGGHWVVMVGYLRDYPDHVLVRNSWGTSWGLDGYFLMPWSYACDLQFSNDWRAIYRPQGQ